MSPCYHCKSARSAFYARENGYDLVKCSVCGLLYVSNPPKIDEIEQAHIQGVHRGDDTLNVTGAYRPLAKSTYREVLRDLFGASFPDKGSWLDIGCGYGEFIEVLNELSQGSLNTFGSEPNIYKRKSARQRGLNVEFLDLDNHRKKYHVISLLNVYSHLPDPPQFIRNLRGNLVEGGELVIQTGDTAGLSARDHYRPFYLPDHLSFVSEEILAEMLEENGLEIIAVKKYPYLKPGDYSVIKEAIKLILPRYSSRLRYLILKKYSNTDMYIRARKVRRVNLSEQE
ncbi:MAG: class I SAM-dependent methyltransferase [Betaproteobacteria bacterium]|nr:MAG: class I SAM-dependent methyltransferase [Betaproteobacteria bacterium]